MREKIELRVNGAVRAVETDPERPLLEVLREDLGLTGAKYGCGEGQCRACTVLLDGRPVASCRTLVESAAGAEIRTIEGLEQGGELHSVQRGFLEAEALQCGYCTPGMVLATVALLESDPEPGDDEIVTALDGHLCRCSCYPRILDAVRLASAAVREGR